MLNSYDKKELLIEDDSFKLYMYEACVGTSLPLTEYFYPPLGTSFPIGENKLALELCKKDETRLFVNHYPNHFTIVNETKDPRKKTVIFEYLKDIYSKGTYVDNSPYEW